MPHLLRKLLLASVATGIIAVVHVEGAPLACLPQRGRGAGCDLHAGALFQSKSMMTIAQEPNEVEAVEGHTASLLGVGTSGMSESQLMVQAEGRALLAAAAEVQEVVMGTDGTEIRRNVSNAELANMITTFINNQAASEDKCPARLMEAKHQLNDLHQHLLDLAAQVHATEDQVKVLDKGLRDNLDEMGRLDTWRDEELAKCGDQKTEYQRMLALLRGEMKEMQQISRPETTMSIPRAAAPASTAAPTTAAPVATTTAAPAAPAAPTTAEPVATTTAAPDVTTTTEDVSPAQQAQQALQAHQAHQLPGGAHQAQQAHQLPGGSGQANATHNTTVPAGLVAKDGHQRAGGVGHDAGHEVQDEDRDDDLQGPDDGDGEPGISLVELSTGPHGTVSTVQHLVRETKDAADSVVACVLGWSKSRTSQRPLSLLEVAEGAQNCSANTSVDVTVGNTTKSITVAREIADRGHAPLSCTEIDPGFVGMVWLDCDGGSITPDAGKCSVKGTGAVECQQQKDLLEKTYVKAYVELARLVAEYEDLANSTSCSDSVMTEYRTRRAPLSQKAAELTEEMTEKIDALQDLRPRLADASTAEAKLREQIDKLGDECDALPATSSDLDKVRLAIKALEKCPGLGKPEFHIPKWVGQWVSVTVDAKTMPDSEIDRLIAEACAAGNFTGGATVRPASAGEIESGSIEGQPKKNTATAPLIGTCPNCEGTIDGAGTPSHQSGHARVCWDPAATLNMAGKRTDCTMGAKAVMCVHDRGNIRVATPSL